jgi:GNAT superfamily N-acetyltransferase
MAEDRLHSRLALAHHRVVTRVLAGAPGLIDEARAVVGAWKADAPHQPFVGQWESLLAEPPETLVRAMVAGDTEAAALRRASPFVLVPSLILDHQRVTKLWRVAAGHATRILPRSEYPKYARHLKKLGERDRFRRFWQNVGDGWIDRYVAAIGTGPGEAVIGHFAGNLELDGAIHVGLIDRLGERYGEFGVSVLPEARHHGIGYHLLHRATLWARNHGAIRLCVVCQGDNYEMIKLAREHDIEVRRATGEAEGAMAFQPGDADTVSQEILENQIGEWDYAAKAHDTAFAYAVGAPKEGATNGADGTEGASRRAQSRLDKLAQLGRVDVLSGYLIMLRYALLMESPLSPAVYRYHLTALRGTLAPKLEPHPEAHAFIMGLPEGDRAPLVAA